jgi:hypothetical protein
MGSVMNFIAVTAVTDEVAREQAAAKSGYAPESIGALVRVIDDGDNSRQRVFIFKTTNDVTVHMHYAKARLSDAFQPTGHATNDGPVLLFGPEITAGG